MRLSGNTRLAYVARMRCLLGLGVSILLTARIVVSTRFWSFSALKGETVVSISLILSGTIEGGAH